MIKYLGSKRRLVPHIRAIVGALPDVRTVLDAFSGTSRVARALKADGYDVVANDHNAYAFTFARCYVEADRDAWLERAEALIDELATVPPNAGYFTRTFCEEARFLRPENGARVDAIRARITDLALPPLLQAIALTSLVEAADRVDSTVGVQMAYLKRWAPRAMNDLELRVPELLPGRGQAAMMDAADAAEAFEVDVAYLDPPYNQHSYRGNYHVWETLVLGDEPEAYGVARKRVDCREKKSAYNSKVAIGPAFERLLDRLRARYIVVSFNNEGYLAPEALAALLSARGAVRVFEFASDRYVGARIGIHAPSGERVGEPGHLRNKELLFVAAPDEAALAAVEPAIASLR